MTNIKKKQIGYLTVKMQFYKTNYNEFDSSSHVGEFYLPERIPYELIRVDRNEGTGFVAETADYNPNNKYKNINAVYGTSKNKAIKKLTASITEAFDTYLEGIHEGVGKKKKKMKAVMDKKRVGSKSK